MDQPTVVFFDGVCGLCNGVVDFILRFDQNGTTLFSPLQSDFAQSKLPAALIQDLSSLVVLKGSQVFTQSDAFFVICKQLGGLFQFFLIFKILPKSVLDLIYNWVSKHRYQIFGKKQFCRIPTESERKRFM